MEQSVIGGSGIHFPNSKSQSCIGDPFQCGQVAFLLPHMTVESSKIGLSIHRIPKKHF